MNGTQCDTCRKFSQDSSDWFFVIHLRPYAGLFTGQQQEIVGCFCTVSCLADYSYARAVSEEKPVEGKTELVKPAPRTRRKTSD